LRGDVREGLPEPSPRPNLAAVVTSCHDEYFSSFRQLRLNGFVLARATGKWSLRRCRLSSCVLEHGVDAAPWAASGSTADGVLTFAFPGNPDTRLSVDGQDVSQDTLCLWPGGARVSIVARRPADLFVVSAAQPVLAALATRTTGLPPPCTAFTPFRVRPEQLVRVRALASRVMEAVEETRPAGLGPEACGALERALLGELLKLATGPRSDRGNGSSRIDRRRVLESVEGLLDARPSQPVYVADLCAATGLPERTLRFILVEQYGTSPIRLLRCRRLCELRRCLQAGDTGSESLARIASRYGFRHMGTLAADYRALFGELPSETRRAVGELLPLPVPPRLVALAREATGRRTGAEVAAAADAAGR
jgi:AraC family ethanolamine operon transcriptional activator